MAVEYRMKVFLGVRGRNKGGEEPLQRLREEPQRLSHFAGLTLEGIQHSCTPTITK